LVDMGVVPVLIAGKFHIKISVCVCVHTHTWKPRHQDIWEWRYSYIHPSDGGEWSGFMLLQILPPKKELLALIR
jgi:hypothetical protein